MTNITATLRKIDEDIRNTNPLEQYRPRTPVEVVEKTGDIVGDSITKMFRRVAEQVREEAQAAVDCAVAAQKEADALAADIIAMGEKHARSLTRGIERPKKLLELMEQQRSIFANGERESEPS